jgi:HD-GYP domain-containing protein (c-di-GMP phosphodiesterase class II)
MEWRNTGSVGQSERVARNAVSMARVLGLDEDQEMTVLLGAYLHDVGMVRVPQDILNKTGALTPTELDVLRMHPIWGLDLLGNVEFPWDLRPIVRSHHEHYDGSGYPDRLAGDAIPITAQIIGVLDEFERLLTKRGASSSRSGREAVEQLHDWRAWWSNPVFDAFLRVVTAPA